MMVTHLEKVSTKKIPYIRETPLLGSFAAFMSDNRLTFLNDIAQEHDVCGFHMGPIPIVIMNRPEYIQSVLVEHAYDFSKGRIIHKAVTGNGLFVSEGDFHRRQRKIMAPSFQPRHIESYATTMVRYGELLQQQWLNGETININRHMNDLTMSIIGKVLFDVDVFDETNELGAAMTTAFAHASRKLSSPFMPPLSWPTQYNRRVRDAIQAVEFRIQAMIDERRQEESQEKRPVRNDFLSVLLAARDDAGEPMHDSQLLDECITLFGAGHETTAAALAWTWYFLCHNPEVYARVQHEVDAVLQGRMPTFDDLPSLPLCLQVFKEAMRLYPPAPGILREALHDVTIDGYILPKGCNVLLSSYTMHRKPEYFPKPEQFEPERFAPEREKLLPRYAYIPFGAGPRICIGNHFALMEGQLLIAVLAQRATFTLVPGQHIVPDAVHGLALRPGVSMHVVVNKR